MHATTAQSLLSGFPFPDVHDLPALLTSCLPACRDHGWRVIAVSLREVVTGRRGKVFGLADVTFADPSTASQVSKRMVLQRFAGTVAREEGAKVFRRLRHRVARSSRRQQFRPYAAHVAERALFVSPFPFDYRLPMLVEAADPNEVIPVLGTLIGGDAVVRCDVRPVRYVPEKRCQIRYDLVMASGARLAIYGKVTADHQAAKVFEWMRVLHDGFRGHRCAAVPRSIGYIDRWHMLLQEAVPGTTLYERQRASCVCLDDYERVGAALAHLHGQRLDALTVHGPEDECALLDDAVAKGTLGGGLAARALTLVRRLRGARSCVADRPLVTAHRDFYDKQVLVHGGRLHLIDFDTMALAPRELDLANFIAHAQLRAFQGHLAAPAVEGIADAVREGYRSAMLPDDVVDSRALAWFVSATLIRLATIYAVRPGGAHLPERLVQAATESLDRADELGASRLRFQALSGRHGGGRA